MNPKQIFSFSPEYLRDYSNEHLWYEIWMFFQTGVVLPVGVDSPEVGFISNAILESFAIHLRNLLDFFYPNGRPKPDDIVAAYYYHDGELPPTFPPKSELLNNSEVRAHKQVSHLTTKRFTGHHPEKRWHTATLMGEMAELVMAFVETASHDRLPPEFSHRVRTLLRECQRKTSALGGCPGTRD